MAKTKKEIDIDRERVFEMLPDSIKDNAYASKIGGISGIAPFNESFPPKEGLIKYRMKIAIDIVTFEEEKPFLAIELETSTDPKQVMGLFPLYMLTRWIKLRQGNIDLNQYLVESPFLLLIILPPLTDTLREKWLDLEDKLREILDLDGNKLSTLTDFEICELPDFKPILKRLLDRNGYEKYAKELR
jgi:hypothetical protein